MEIGTAAQLPTEPCSVHGEPRPRLVRDLPSEGELPRAELAVDLSQVTPVVGEQSHAAGGERSLQLRKGKHETAAGAGKRSGGKAKDR